MGWIVILVAIGIGGLLFWQNLAAITLSFFGGIMTVTLPIALWVLLFLFAGIVSSLTLQFLYRFGRPFAPPTVSPRTPSPTSPPRQSPRPTGERETLRQPAPPVSPPSSDWERDNSDEDWNLANPPQNPTVIQNPDINPDIFDRTLPEDDALDFEVPSSPKTPSRTESVYSYRYRTAQQTKGDKAEPVYDANYRIITPPPREANDEAANGDETEEDWI